MRSQILITGLAAALFLSCTGSPSEPLEPQGAAMPDETYPMRGITHWRNFFDWDESTIADAARAGLVIFPIERCFSPLGEATISRMRELNPDIRILGYLGVLQVPELYPDTTYLEQYLPWEIEFYRLVEDRWAWTTSGDTLSLWPGSIFLDPIDPAGRVDAGLIDDIVGLLEKYVEERPGMIDGVMHDYFMYRPYVNPNNDDVIGDIDLDGDGVPIGDDPDERDLLLRWQKDYAAAIRSRLGPQFIQIANGRVPQEDPELAGYLNGIFYELFPNMCWSVTDREGLEKLVENQSAGWLAKAHGRTWSILTNNSIEYNNMFCMLSGMLTGCFHAELDGDFAFSGWSLGVDAGRALSELEIEGSPDSIVTYRRRFEGGEAIVSFNPGGGRRAWTFIEND